mgnify:CR=1 FL=1
MQEIIAHLKQFTHKESMIDQKKWLHPERLTMKDFEPLLSYVSKRQRKKNVKMSGIGGLVKGKDYLEITDVDFNFDFLESF